MDTPQFRTGMDSVQDAIDRRKSANKDFLPMLVWKNDREKGGTEYTHCLRFMPFPVITCVVYDFVHCDDGTSRTFIAPASVGMSDPDYFLTEGIELQDFTKKWVPAADADREVTFAIAVEREEFTTRQNGRTVLGVRDKIVKRKWIDKENVEHEEEGRQYFLVKQGLKNFWQPFMTHDRRNGGLHTIDYVVERNGGDKSTSYAIVPLSPIEGLQTAEEVFATYDDCPMTLEEYAIPRIAVAENCEPLLGKFKGKGAPQPGDADRGGDAVATTPMFDPGTDAENPALAGQPPSGQAPPAANTRMGSLREELTGAAPK